MAVLKNKYTIKIVDLVNGELLFEECLYDFRRACNIFQFLKKSEKVTNDKGESTYEDKPITIKNYTWDNGMQRYKAVAKGDGFVVSFWGYDADDIMFRISAREYIL